MQTIKCDSCGVECESTLDNPRVSMVRAEVRVATACVGAGELCVDCAKKLQRDCHGKETEFFRRVVKAIFQGAEVS